MKTLVSVVIAALAIPTLPLAVQAQGASPAPAASGAMQGGGAVTLLPMNKKGAGGSAILSQSGTGLTVTLHVPEGYAATNAGIYTGTCATSGMTSAKSGNMSATTSGNMSATTSGNMSATTSGNMSATKSGTTSSTMSTQGGSPAYKLQAPTNGSSQTVLNNVSVEKLTSGQYKIVVQGTPQLCGDVKNLLPPQKP